MSSRNSTGDAEAPDNLQRSLLPSSHYSWTEADAPNSAPQPSNTQPSQPSSSPFLMSTLSAVTPTAPASSSSPFSGAAPPTTTAPPPPPVHPSNHINLAQREKAAESRLTEMTLAPSMELRMLMPQASGIDPLDIPSLLPNTLLSPQSSHSLDLSKDTARVMAAIVKQQQQKKEILTAASKATTGLSLSSPDTSKQQDLQESALPTTAPAVHTSALTAVTEAGGFSSSALNEEAREVQERAGGAVLRSAAHGSDGSTVSQLADKGDVSRQQQQKEKEVQQLSPFAAAVQAEPPHNPPTQQSVSVSLSQSQQQQHAHLSPLHTLQEQQQQQQQLVYLTPLPPPVLVTTPMPSTAQLSTNPNLHTAAQLSTNPNLHTAAQLSTNPGMHTAAIAPLHAPQPSYLLVGDGSAYLQHQEQQEQVQQVNALQQTEAQAQQEGELAAQAQQDAQLQELQAKMNELEIQKLEIQVHAAQQGLRLTDVGSEAPAALATAPTSLAIGASKHSESASAIGSIPAVAAAMPATAPALSASIPATKAPSTLTAASPPVLPIVVSAPPTHEDEEIGSSLAAAVTARLQATPTSAPAAQPLSSSSTATTPLSHISHTTPLSPHIATPNVASNVASSADLQGMAPISPALSNAPAPTALYADNAPPLSNPYKTPTAVYAPAPPPPPTTYPRNVTPLNHPHPHPLHMRPHSKEGEALGGPALKGFSPPTPPQQYQPYLYAQQQQHPQQQQQPFYIPSPPARNVVGSIHPHLHSNAVGVHSPYSAHHGKAHVMHDASNYWQHPYPSNTVPPAHSLAPFSPPYPPPPPLSHGHHPSAAAAAAAPHHFGHRPGALPPHSPHRLPGEQAPIMRSGRAMERTSREVSPYRSEVSPYRSEGGRSSSRTSSPGSWMTEPTSPTTKLSWCHVQHSKRQMPTMSQSEVKELVKAQLQTRKPIRAPWYRGTGYTTPGSEAPGNDPLLATPPQACPNHGAQQPPKSGTGFFIPPSLAAQLNMN